MCSISGTVQGVWFRAWTMQEARGARLDGWVRNRRDGDVEALFAGPADQVDDMIARLPPRTARRRGDRRERDAKRRRARHGIPKAPTV